MGDGYASPIIGGLGALIRDNIRSRNYVAGVSGWAIFANGFAEFLDLLVRGHFSTGTTGNRVEIFDSGGFSVIQLWSADADETYPASVANYSSPSGGTSVSALQFDSSDDSDGQIAFILYAPESVGAPVDAGGTFLFVRQSAPHAPAAAAISAVRLEDRIKLHLAATNLANVSPTSTNHPFQIGPDNSTNMIMDRNEIMCRVAGATAPLYLQNVGGLTDVGPGGLTSHGLVTAASFTNQDDTGWVNVTVAGGFAAQAGDAPQVRRIGNIVYARGGWSNTGMAINTTHNVGTIPAGSRPLGNVVGRAGTSTGATQATMFVTPAGAVQIRTGGALSAYYLFGGESWPND